MDTDCLTEDAYEALIVESGNVSEYLRADIGMSASEYSDEDSYLKGALKALKEIVDDSMDYLEGWSLEEDIDADEFKQDVLKLIEKINKVINTPLKDRGKPEFK